MKSRRRIAFAKLRTTPNFTFSSDHKNRKLRPGKWGAMVNLRCTAQSVIDLKVNAEIRDIRFRESLGARVGPATMARHAASRFPAVRLIAIHAHRSKTQPLMSARGQKQTSRRA